MLPRFTKKQWCTLTSLVPKRVPAKDKIFYDQIISFKVGVSVSVVVVVLTVGVAGSRDLLFSGSCFSFQGLLNARRIFQLEALARPGFEARYFDVLSRGAAAVVALRPLREGHQAVAGVAIVALATKKPSNLTHHFFDCHC